MKFKVRINPVAMSDVLELMAHIAEDNPEATARVGSLIYSRIEELADFPEMGASLRAKVHVRTDYRFLVCGAYLVFYKVEGEFVSIYRVLNGARDYLAILFVEELSNDH